MISHVVAFAGLPHTGKTTLSRAVAEALRLPFASFGDEVRRVAIQARQLPNPSRFQLQEIGQELATSRTEEFCDAVLKRSSSEGADTLVLDGLRHKQVLAQLQKLCQRVIVIYVNSSISSRASRSGLSETQEHKIEAHPVESEHKEMKRVADFILDTSAQTKDQSVAALLSWLPQCLSQVSNRLSHT